MDLQVRMAVHGDLYAFMRKREKGVASAVTRAVRGVTFGLQREIQRQAKKAKFSNPGLEKLMIAKVLPKRGYEPDAEGVVYSVAMVERSGEEVDLYEVFDRGATIRAKGGKWLAIPTDDAAAKRGNQFGGLIKFRAGQLQKLRARAEAAGDSRLSRKSKRGAAKRFATANYYGQADLQFVPTSKPDLAMLAYVSKGTGERKVAYWLVKQVKLRKRFDLKRAEQKWLPKLAPRINSNLDRFVYKTGDDI